MAHRSLSFSLLVACLLVLLTSSQPSAALSHFGNPNAPRHIRHVQLIDGKRRMVKVRDIFGIRQGNKPADDIGSNTGGTTGGTNDPGNAQGSVSPSSSIASTTQATTTTPAQAETQTQQTQAVQSQSTQTTTSTSQSQSTTSVASSTSSSTTSSAAVPTPPASATLNIVAQPTPPPGKSSFVDPTLSVATAQVTVDLPTQSAAADNNATSANTFGRNTIIAIVVIASCVGGAAAIWTLIRKWKLGPSAKFDERMAPVEWNPDLSSVAGAGIPGSDREKAYGSTEKHSRSGSHGSFHSSDAEHSNLGRNVTGNGNMFADQNPTTYGSEAHDFTAGPAQYGPSQYGPPGYDASNNPAAGYVDLQRSNSDGSNRGDNAGLQRGPSMGRSTTAPYAYDNGYGGAAYAQDPYVGYSQQYPPPQGQYGAPQGQYGARY